MAIDAAVVGAGIVGLSTALHLAERGAGRIIVYERAGIGAGASGVQPGGVRQQWSTRLNCAMARDSLAFYSQLRERLQPRVDPGSAPAATSSWRTSQPRWSVSAATSRCRTTPACRRGC